MFTEEEAKKKECPFHHYKKGKCIASECMMWRWNKLSQQGPDDEGWCGVGNKQ